jgi:sugar lactone lactonase YvrE
MRHRIALSSLFVCAALAACTESPSGGPVPTAPALRKSAGVPTARLLLTLQSAQGSTIGPGGALFVTEPKAGRIVRIDPETGAATTFASGLPYGDEAIVGLGSGAVDVAFIGGTAYVLVTGVDPEVGGSAVNGIYRIDSPTSYTVIADIGAWSKANLPATPFDAASGFQYALETFRGGFLVTDGHHNRVLQVSRDGVITQLIQFADVVPTGLAVRGNTIYLAQAGPAPHLPENGKVVTFGPGSTTATQIAAGAPLLVDVERGRGRTLYALSQGIWTGTIPGDPASPNTGTLLRVNENGTFTTVYSGLDRPTSVEIVGTTAYVVSLSGDIWVIDNIGGPPFGH